MSSELLKPLAIFCSHPHSQKYIKTNTTPSTKSTTPPKIDPGRHYRIFPDYGTDFIWLRVDDLRPGESSHLDAEEILSSFPPSVLELYDTWVQTYHTNFKQRCEETQNYQATVFLTVSEEVAWTVAEYLLAWRIALEPFVGSVEYAAGKSKYLMERGKETSVTLRFLYDQLGFLGRGVPSV